MNTIAESKTRFIELLNSVKRKGIDRLIEWIQGTDFFTAPASTRFHGAYEGGLVEHSLNVYDAYIRLFGDNEESTESITLRTLLHDLCKSGFYITEMRNRKNEQGKWEQAPFYTIDDKFPYGHGEKSVFMIERFIRLTTNEALAVRWHMGGFDESTRGGSYAQSNAYDMCPFAVKLHMADLYASYLMEERGVKK